MFKYFPYWRCCHYLGDSNIPIKRMANSRDVCLFVFVLNVPLTTKVIWIWGDVLKTHLTDLGSQGSNMSPYVRCEWLIHYTTGAHIVKVLLEGLYVFICKTVLSFPLLI